MITYVDAVLPVIGAALLSVYFIVVLRIPWLVKRAIWKDAAHRHRIKPLDCEHCLAFWLSIIFFLPDADFLVKNWQKLPYIGGSAAIVAILITKLVNR